MTYDIDSFVAVRVALHVDPLQLYSLVNPEPPFHWPYPAGFLPWIPVAGWLAEHVGLGFDGWVQVPAILADLGIALLVQYYLGLRGSAERTRLFLPGSWPWDLPSPWCRAITDRSTRWRSCLPLRR